MLVPGPARAVAHARARVSLRRARREGRSLRSPRCRRNLRAVRRQPARHVLGDHDLRAAAPALRPDPYSPRTLESRAGDRHVRFRRPGLRRVETTKQRRRAALADESGPAALEVELRADLEEPRRHDRQRVEIRRPVGLVEHLRRIRVEQVEDVEADERLGRAVPEDLAKPEIDGIDAIAVQRARLDDVQEFDGNAAGKRPPEVRAVDARDSKEQRGRLCADALALHGGEFVPGIRQAAERAADQHIDFGHGVRRQPLQVRLPSRLAIAGRLRPLPDAAEERVEEPVRAAPGTEDVGLRVILDHAARVFHDVPRAEPALERHLAHARVQHEVDTVERVGGAADAVGERQVVVDLLELRGFHVIERQRVPAAARQLRILRHVVHERIEVGRCPRAVDRGRQVAPAPPDVVELDRYFRSHLLRHSECQIPAVLACVPSIRRRRVNCQRRLWLPEERVPRPALAVGGRVQQVAVDDVVAVRVGPVPRVLRDKVPEPGRAVVRPLVHGVERRHVPAHEELHGRLSVAEKVVGCAEPGHQVFLAERTGLRREIDGGGQEQVGTHLLGREIVAEVLEAEPGLQRQTPERPAILRVQRDHALLLFLVRVRVGVRRDLVWYAVLEDVLELFVVVEVDRVVGVVAVPAEADLRRV